jgi:hypothetical protein
MALYDIWRRILHRLRLLRLALTMQPIAGGAPDGDDAGDGDGGGDADGGGADDGADDDAGADDGDSGADTTDWKAEARKHEKRAKQAAARAAKFEADAKKAADAAKTDQEKALDKAREEARAEATAEAQKALRKERLTAAVARHAAGKFADVDDAIRLLDVEDDDIFDDDGTVQTEPLKQALGDLLEAKPHLAAGTGKPQGDAGGGKGNSGKDLDEKSADDFLKDIQTK